MDAAGKAYILAIVVQLIYTGMSVISKAAFDAGMSTFVFVFYRQAAGSSLMLPLALLLRRKNARPMPFMWLLKLFLCALVANTLSLSLYNVSLKFTSATVAAAASNSMPVVTFCLALLLRLEIVNLTTGAGIAKVTGAALCLAGVFVIAFYTGPALSPVNHHRAMATHPRRRRLRLPQQCESFPEDDMDRRDVPHGPRQHGMVPVHRLASLLKECPNRMIVAAALFIFSAAQSFVVAVVAERDFSRWRLRPDVSLLAIAYTVIVMICLLVFSILLVLQWAHISTLLAAFPLIAVPYILLQQCCWQLYVTDRRW
ncbi:hypothetical protein ACP4OV_019128 [Aristida adscensionis]